MKKVEWLTLRFCICTLITQGGAVLIQGGSGSFTGCTLSGNSAVSVVSRSWRCVFASCDWRETMK